MIQAEQLHARILEELDLSRDIPDEELTELIHRVLDEASGREYIPLGKKAELGRELFNAFRKFDLLQEFLEDDKITEIMINGTENIFLEKEGKLIRSGKRFVSREKLEDVIQQIVAGSNRIVNEASPIVDARLPDGSRVNVVLGPIALNGPIVTIRKFPKEAITMKQLIRWGSICREVKEFLVKLVRAGYNIFISGGTGSGKTTFLNALSQYIPKDERIITIEDNAELRILDIPNLVTLEARCANLEGTGEITIRELIRTALRMRPNRIIVGEVRGAEAIDMLQALNTGHDGSLSTGHANSPKDMLSRLESMVLMGMDLPLRAVQRQIASGIDIIVHLGRLRDKSRKVLEVSEILDYQDGEILVSPLYRFEETGEKDGKIQGTWRKIQLLDECIKRKEQEFLVQFKELIQTFSSLLNTGYSVENAVKESLKEMQVFYSDDAAILRELEIMVRQIRVQVPVEQAVEELSERTKLPDVESFAGVFVTAKRSGGNLMSIIRNTADQIGDKIDVKREIDTMLAAKKYEFQVMSVIPFGIVLYMTVSFPEFMGNLYGNIAGRGVMTGCLIIYLGAYGLGRKIIEIEV